MSSERRRRRVEALPWLINEVDMAVRIRGSCWSTETTATVAGRIPTNLLAATTLVSGDNSGRLMTPGQGATLLRVVLHGKHIEQLSAFQPPATMGDVDQAGGPVVGSKLATPVNPSAGD